MNGAAADFRPGRSWEEPDPVIKACLSEARKSIAQVRKA
jgi:hypothetical protein